MKVVSRYKKDGVTMTSSCDEVLDPNRNYFYNCMKTTRVKLSGDKDAYEQRPLVLRLRTNVQQVRT